MDDENDLTIDAHNKKTWVCIKCINDNIPFGNLDEKQFYLNSRNINAEHELNNISFTLNPSDKKITETISKMIIENTDPDNPITNFCKYYEIDDFQKAKFSTESNLSTLHLNQHCFAPISH